MLSPGQLFRRPWASKLVGLGAAQYLRLVWRTNQFIVDPDDGIERMKRAQPVIMTMWHGHHFLTPFVKPREVRAKVLISRHRDGEINAIAAERLGIETIRGSGTRTADVTKKGGVYGFKALVSTLREGINVSLTADVPTVSRAAGLGVVKIAQVSGRPIFPVAIATSRRHVLDNWDRTVIHLPFGRGAMVFGAPIHVPFDADDATLELARRAVEESLNAATARAYELVDRSARGGDRG
jgi:lysophospholipid acyltransferase (LPLAT)-like uncharacterized protein